MSASFTAPHLDPGHVRILLDSYRRWTGADLLGSPACAADAARRLFDAPFAVVSHDTAPDPVFNYGNATALALFEMTWEQFTATPSRLSAEPLLRAERERLLARVAADGFIDDYAGIRISRTGRRFRIRRATVWNLLNASGAACGQAATFAAWEWL